VIDGTDLLQRGLSNWCSAIVIYDPHEMQIYGAFVAVISDFRDYFMYYATWNRPGAYKKVFRIDADGNVIIDSEQRLPGPQSERDLRDASVCLYAQKSERLLELLNLNRNEVFVNWLRENEKESARMVEEKRAMEVKFRFYDLAGNPMMVRIAEGIIDVVLDLAGQSPHDVVPGAYIAMRAGAKFWDRRENRKLSENEFVSKLLHPETSKVKYVIAANDAMLQEMVNLLSRGRTLEEGKDK
jgi:fructose-1,6-bisphosphatase/inositol monophosphatase family enzyme